MASDKPYVYVPFKHFHLFHLITEAFNVVEDTTDPELCKKVTGLFGGPFVTVEVLDKFPSLKVIGNCGVGYDNIDLAACRARGIRVGNTPNVLNDTTADVAIALLLAVARKVVEGNYMCKHDPTFTSLDFNRYGYQVSGMTAGIIGLGRIGFEVAKRLCGFDMEILYYGRTKKRTDVEAAVKATYVPDLYQMLSRCDYVILVAPATSETYHMMGKKEFEAMKSTGILVNISRGSLVNQDDLVEAIKTNSIGGAGLDVTSPEPLPRDHELLKLPNVIITPHIGSATYHTRKKMVQLTIDNIQAGLKGEPMPAEVKLD
jgi:glyoxylate reductase